MADNQNQAVETKYILSNAQLIGWVRKLRDLEIGAQILRQEELALNAKKQDNQKHQLEVVGILTKHMKNKGKHREIVFLEQSQPQAALIEHQSWTMYPSSPVSVTFIDDPVR